MNGSKPSCTKTNRNGFRPLRRLDLAQRIFGQSILMGLKYLELSMSSSSARKAAICFCWGILLALSPALMAQTNYYGAGGTEYAITGPVPGDQVWPDIALG